MRLAKRGKKPVSPDDDLNKTLEDVKAISLKDLYSMKDLYAKPKPVKYEQQYGYNYIVDRDDYLLKAIAGGSGVPTTGQIESLRKENAELKKQVEELKLIVDSFEDRIRVLEFDHD